MADLINPIERAIELPDGGTKTFILSKFPATVGREIVTQYPLSAVPKLGDYGRNEELMFKCMQYVAVPGAGAGGQPLRMTTEVLINNHVPDFETLIRIEMAMMELNCSFFSKGKASDFLGSLVEKAKALATSMLTDYLRPSSKNDTQA